MPDEVARRRPDFRRGVPIRLADGREWIFPVPPDGAPPRDAGSGRGPCTGPEAENAALVEAISVAEDEAERCRAELALAIYLLGQNYDLGPNDFQALLEPSDHSITIAMQRAFHDLAMGHVLASGPQGRAPETPRGQSWGALIRKPPLPRRRPVNQAT